MIINHTHADDTRVSIPMRGAADNIFDQNDTAGLLTKQQHGGSPKSVE